MQIGEAQSEVRRAFLGGFAGQLVSGCLWLISAAVATWGTERSAILVLVVGGVFIFPLTVFFLRAAGHTPVLSPDNSLHRLGMQVAFTLPLTLPLVGAAALYRLNWFYPAFMVALGAHYLPFVFLYGMRMYAVLCAVLVAGGLGLALYGPDRFSPGGWFTGVILVIAAFAGRAAAARGDRNARPPTSPGE